MSPPDQETGAPSTEAEIKPEADAATQPDMDSAKESESQKLGNFSKSESHAVGFADKLKDMFSGKKAISTVMTMGYLFTWSERVLTYFRTGFSWYRDVPKMITGKNLEGHGRLSHAKNAVSNIGKLFVPGSSNSFLGKYSTGEKLESIGTVLGLAQNTWFITTSRAGDIPDGDTWIARFKNVLKNPSHHAAQVGSIWMAGAVGSMAIGRVMIGIENLSHNAQGQKIGFNPGKAIAGLDGISKAEKLMPLIAGTSLLIYVPLTLYGLLNIKKPKQSVRESSEATLATEAEGDVAVPGHDKDTKSFSKSSSEIQSAGKKSGLMEIASMFAPSNLKDMAHYIAKNDPIGFTGRMLGFALDIGSFGVGFARLKQIDSGQYAHKFGAAGSSQWNTARANAIQTRNVGILGFALTALYNMYVYDTVMHASRKEQETLKASADATQMAR